MEPIREERIRKTIEAMTEHRLHDEQAAIASQTAPAKDGGALGEAVGHLGVHGSAAVVDLASGVLARAAKACCVVIGGAMTA